MTVACKTRFYLELSDIGVVALFCVLVSTLQDRLLLYAGHCLLLEMKMSLKAISDFQKKNTVLKAKLMFTVQM